MLKDELCSHLENLHNLKKAKEFVCEECIKTGDEWVHLRTCQTCGATLCCDASPNKHASRHAHASGHPVAISAQPGERWAYCYVDEQMAFY
ncbi:MAG TPA: UBP-type zinc finger domain-containing protein [Ohtaekwangia sp.]|uniref:UBP-type zinc finger domain-containing protein n=1 Tax=Ohtaekwangia sp. TaxID=2066019 RepID=UPI002F953BB9